jgi:hypothetical protein
MGCWQKWLRLNQAAEAPKPVHCAGPLVVLSLVSFLAMPVGPYTNGDDQAPLSLRQQLVAEARQKYEPQVAEFFAGHVQFWGAYIWSLRWMEAERKLAPQSPQARVAERAHLDRVRSMEKWSKEEVGAGRGGILRYLESDFYRAVAECTLSRKETENPQKTASAHPELVRLAAAQLLYEEAWTSLKSRGGPSCEIVADWSLAIRDGEMALRTDQLSRRVAAEAHLERMKDVESTVRSWFETKKGVQSHDLAKMVFFRADAQVFLTELTGPSKSAEERRAEAARQRLDSAKAVYEGTWETFLEHRTYPEFVYEWSMYWRNAALAIGQKKADRIAASEAHLKRMNDLRTFIKEKFNRIPTRHILASEYYRTEAEILLEEAKAK